MKLASAEVPQDAPPAPASENNEDNPVINRKAPGVPVPGAVPSPRLQPGVGERFIEPPPIPETPPAELAIETGETGAPCPPLSLEGLEAAACAVWEDMTEDVYYDDTLEDLFHDPCDLFHLGRGFWNCRGCYYAPLHYEQVRTCVLTPNTPYAGASWYRGVPVGHRNKIPLAGGSEEYDKSEVVP